jgi:Ca2+:H+ antiporter
VCQVPLSVLVAWVMGVPMDLDFHLVETGSLFLAILVTTFTLQVRFFFSLHNYY